MANARSRSPAVFFTSWPWIGTLLAAVPAAHRPALLRGAARGETVGLALLGAGVTRRRHGLVRSRALYLNETGDRRFDSITIELKVWRSSPFFSN